MKNISDIQDCYGCGVCATACPQKIIELVLNDDGFYEPHIMKADACTNCGLCRTVCSYCNDNLSLADPVINSYAAWSKDYAVRRKCSSGGVGFELGKYLIEEGYRVCGVRYNAEKGRAEHYIATTIDELIPSIGSKYIQSYTLDGFLSIDRNQKYMVTGTPCQIDSFRRYIHKFHREDNFVLMDFFCHGVPSMLVWQKYIKEVEKTTGKILYASWRNKHTRWHHCWAMEIDDEEHGEKINWHDSYDMLIKGEKGYLESRLSQGDMFYKLFLGDQCLGKACYEHCKFKYDHSSADIRIGDAWGVMYKENEDGVSAAIAFTEKGKEILHSCNCELVEHSLDVIAEGQMRTAPTKMKLHKKIFKLLIVDDISIYDICKMIDAHIFIQRNIGRINHPLSIITYIITRILKKK